MTYKMSGGVQMAQCSAILSGALNAIKVIATLACNMDGSRLWPLSDIHTETGSSAEFTKLMLERSGIFHEL